MTKRNQLNLQYFNNEQEYGEIEKMIYNQIKPHPDLADYIDAFWLVKGTEKQLKKKNILPDGCIDLIFNLGDNCKTDSGALTMQSNKSYLVGTMTTFKESFLSSKNMLMGIQFKPAAFSLFYNYASLNEITDKTIEFEQSLSPDIHKVELYSVSYLNEFFLNTLSSQRSNLSTVIKGIQTAKGQISIDVLAKEIVPPLGSWRGISRNSSELAQRNSPILYVSSLLYQK